MGVVGVAEGQQLRDWAVRQRGQFGLGQRRVRPGGPAHRLRGVVDQDVQRPGISDRVGEADDLCRVAQVDTDDPQPVQPVPGIGPAGKPAYGITGKTGRDRRVSAVAEQAKRDVHPDLRAATGEQCPLAGQVGARVPSGVAEGRTVRTQLVIEGVDAGVVLLADVAGPRLQQRARTRCRRRSGERNSPCLVVDAVSGAGRGGGDHRAVGVGDLLALLVAPGLLRGFEHMRRRTANRDEIRVFRVEVVQFGQNGEGHLQPFGVDAVRIRCLPFGKHSRV